MTAEGIGHVDHWPRLADGALVPGWLAQAAGHPEKLRMGVADVGSREAAPAELVHHGIAAEAVVDLAAEAVVGGGAGQELGPRTHGRTG